MRLFILYILLAVFCLGFVPGAFAQGAFLESRGLRELTVQERRPLDLTPQGLQFKGLSILPSLRVDGGYDDNVFYDENGEVDDFFTQVSPAVTVIKHYGPHTFDLSAKGTFSRYASVESENTEDYTLGTRGLIEATKSLSFLYDLGHARKALQRSDPSDVRFAREPINTKASGLKLGANYGFNRLNLSLLGRLARHTYEDGESRVDGSVIIGGTRNRNVKGLNLRASYDILGKDKTVPEHVVFAEMGYSKEKFDRVVDENGLITAAQRDNQELGFLVGLNTRYKGLVHGRAAFGYFFRDFDQNDDVDRFDVDLNVAFNVAPKMTLILEANRDVNQDNSFSTGVVRSEAKATVDYEFLHNLYAGVHLGYVDSEFTGDQDGRQDETLTYGLQARYLHSPYFESRLNLEHIGRSSNQAQSEYDKNTVMYSLISQY